MSNHVFLSPPPCQVLSEHLNKAVQGLPKCPLPPSGGVAGPEMLRAYRAQLQNWLRHVLLFPAVKELPFINSFLTEHANTPPAYLDIYWGHGRLPGSGSCDDDEMEMDDLFDR